MHTRYNLPELEDQPWLPAPLRRGMLDVLGWLLETLRPYDAIVPLLAAAVARTSAPRLVDLGSGGGGGLRPVQAALATALGRSLPVVLTDLYPNLPAFRRLAAETGGALAYEPTPVDATAVPPHLAGFRTLFSTFHHFPEPLARRILANAVAAGQGIGVFEGARKAWWEMAAVWLLFPVIILLITPLLRPFSWRRLLLTYVIPLIPAGVVWDGTASLLRLYPLNALRRLAHEADPDGRFEWQCARVRARLGGSVTYLIGVPREVPTPHPKAV